MKALGVVGLIVAIVAAAAFVFQYRAIQSMQAELGALRGERNSASAQKKARPKRPDPTAVTPVAEMILKNDDAEFARLREELATLRAEVKQIGSAQLELAAAVADGVPVQLVTANEWKNAGRDSPGATMETIYWAALNGELEVLAECFLIPENDRQRVETWWAGLAETTRQQYGTPEQLIGLLIAKEAGPLTGMQVLTQTRVSETDVMLHVRFGLEDGDVDTADYLLRRTADGWRLVVPADGVEWFARHLQTDAPPEK